MSSSDVLEQIRDSRPAAPATLRERVRTLAAEEPVATRPSLLDRLRARPRRLALVAAPGLAVLLVATAGAIGLARSGAPGTTAESISPAQRQLGQQLRGAATTSQDADRSAGGAEATKPSTPPKVVQGVPNAAVPTPNPGRIERYQAFLRLRVDDADALSDAQQQAVQLTRSLGGYVVSLQSSVPEEGTGGAEIVVRVPRLRVQEAIAGFMGLGTIVSQQVQVEDLQQQVDSMTDRIGALTAEIARIQRQLANPDLPLETRSRLSARLAADRRELRELRESRAQTTREGQLATVSLSLTTEETSSAAPAPGRIDRALDKAAEVLAWEAAAALLFLVAVGPLLVFGVLVWLALRVAHRRADDRLLERA
jgi:hypothetical protein